MAIINRDTGYYTSNALAAVQTYWARRPNDAIMRPGMYPFLRVLLQNAPQFLADFDVVKQSDKRQANAHSLDRSPAPVTSARSCTHTSCCGDCTETPITWQTFTAANICKSWGRGADNMFDEDAQFANAVRNRMLDLYGQMEAWCQAYVLANQTTVHNGVGGLGNWAVTDIFQIAIADRLQYFSYLRQMMVANDWTMWDLDFINTLSVGAEFNYIDAQGNQNALNLAWQNAGVTMWQSNTLPVSAGARGDTIIIPKGTVGVGDWIPAENRQGVENKAAKWTQMPSIFGDGLMFAVHITDSCSDTSQTGGVVQDAVENYEISIDLFSAIVPLVLGATPIYHGALLTT